ncbi:DNA binding domain-containing protein, excisionase family [Paenibacillus algorifonticola]|uniref:DNA binding domain-containing protein, excisionase family n=1 Tax=Paenibacillus algorifonticola TaxID=684063 RepID=A0A1I1XYM0_9BACL|nr:helix-turn-helix domain-containing protein [Paenibacillus algorifonticola]SFE10903.1 DNA binding domain-containing protein, excisionase family [Paenibacillus algorifonticola]
MNLSIEAAIRAIIAEEVAAAEQRIRESLNVQSDVTLTFQEALKYLGMSEYTLRRMCQAKKLPYRIVGADGSKNPRYLFSSSSLDKWMKQQEESNYKPNQP